MTFQEWYESKKRMCRAHCAEAWYYQQKIIDDINEKLEAKCMELYKLKNILIEKNEEHEALLKTWNITEYKMLEYRDKLESKEKIK